MKTVTIPEEEYVHMQQTIHTLKAQVILLQDQEFLKKLAFAYHALYQGKASEDTLPPISLKRGSAKEIIPFIAEDFDEPLDDFKEYMS